MELKRWMSTGRFREVLTDRLCAGMRGEDPATAKAACLDAWTALCCTKTWPKEHMRHNHRYAYFDRLGKLKFLLIRGDWVNACSAFMDLIYYFPFTSPGIRSNIVKTLAPYFMEGEGAHEVVPPRKDLLY